MSAVVALASLLIGAPVARAGEIAVGVTTGAQPNLIVFDTDAPGSPLATRPLGGFLIGEQVRGLDMRTASGELLALTGFNRMLAVDPQSGASVQFGPQVDPAVFSTFGAAGFDFNPTVDRLRLVSTGDANVRYNPLSFALVDSDPGTAGTQPDTTVAYDAGDEAAGLNPNVVAAAYDRNDNDPATATTLYAIDSARDRLLTQGGVNGTPSPNGGLLFSKGPLGVDVDDLTSLDIAPGPAGSPAEGVAYMAAVPLGGFSSALYEVNLGAGTATPIGAIAGEPLIGLAIALGGGLSLERPAAAGEGGQAVVTVRRAGETLGRGQQIAVRVPFSTVDGTAVSGSDYTPVAGVLSFAPGEVATQIVVPLLEDAAVEGTETLSLRLGSPVGGAVVTAPERTIELIDNDSAPAASTAPNAAANTTLRLLLSASASPSPKALLASKLKVRFACTSACAVRLVLKLKRVTIATGTAAIGAAGVGEAKLVVAGSGRVALTKALGRGRGPLALKLDGEATGSAPGPALDSIGLSLPRR